jgi:hypothetical protein
LRDEKFMRIALAIEQAIEAFEDDGGNWEEVPMLCGVVIASFAINAKDPNACGGHTPFDDDAIRGTRSIADP